MWLVLGSRCELPHIQCLLDLWAGYHWKILQNTHVYVYYKYTNTFWSIWSGTSTCNCEDTQNLPHTQAIKYLSFYICSRISRIKRASLQPLNKKLLLEPKITQTVQGGGGGVLNSYFCFWHLLLSSVQPSVSSTWERGRGWLVWTINWIFKKALFKTLFLFSKNNIRAEIGFHPCQQLRVPNAHQSIPWKRKDFQFVKKIARLNNWTFL